MKPEQSENSAAPIIRISAIVAFAILLLSCFLWSVIANLGGDSRLVVPIKIKNISERTTTVSLQMQSIDLEPQGIAKSYQLQPGVAKDLSYPTKKSGFLKISTENDFELIRVTGESFDYMPPFYYTVDEQGEIEQVE